MYKRSLVIYPHTLYFDSLESKHKYAGFYAMEKPVKYSTENVLFNRKYLRATNKDMYINSAILVVLFLDHVIFRSDMT